MWKEGSLKVHDSVFHYWMKQYDEGSQYGIDGGRNNAVARATNDQMLAVIPGALAEHDFLAFEEPYRLAR